MFNKTKAPVTIVGQKGRETSEKLKTRTNRIRGVLSLQKINILS